MKPRSAVPWVLVAAFLVMLLLRQYVIGVILCLVAFLLWVVET